MNNTLRELVSSLPNFDAYKQKIALRRVLSYLNSLNKLFLFTVAIPVSLSIIYFGLIASDIYVVESQFVIRSPQSKNLSGLGAILSQTGFSRSQEDSYIVQSYILSSDAVRFLEDTLHLNSHYANSAIDRINRFGGLDFDTSFEALLAYYKKHILITTDSSSSVSTLTVRAFSSDHAYSINKALLDKSEALVNHLNHRAQQDILRFAKGEVASAELKAKQTALALLSYRQQQKVFDPVQQSKFELERISKLQDELLLTKDQVQQMAGLTPKNPQLPVLKQRVEALNKDLADESMHIIGKKSSLSAKALEYERLKLADVFAQKQLTTAFASLEQARIEAERQQVYLERIEHPSKPESATGLHRLRAIFATLLFTCVLWGVLSMLFAGVKEHQD